MVSSSLFYQKSYATLFKGVWLAATFLLAFNRPVNVADEEESCTEANCSEHEEETVTNTSHVTEEERGLHETRHV